MNLVRFDPFRELEQMSTRLSSLFGRAPGGREMEFDGFAAWSPPVDVQETDKEYLIKADLPELSKTDVKVGIDEGILTLEGERKQEKEEKGKKFHRVERTYGKFVRRLAIPSDVDQAKVAADFKDGVLNVHLPKTPNGKSRSIDVTVA
jgi:HSP20 family protein